MTGGWPPMPPAVGPVDPGALAAAAGELAARCPGRVSRDFSLAPLTTFRLGGPAAVFLRAETLDDLAALAGVLGATQVPLLVVGRGSNMLVADAGWPGIVLHLGQRFRRVEIEGTELEAGAATPLPSLAARSAKASLGGIAFAVAIPGTVGGGVRMNAGAHGSELADRLVWADVFHLTGEPPADRGARLEPPGPPADRGARLEVSGPRSGRAVRMKPDELGFGYRRSALPPGAVVTAARFALTPASEAAVRAEIDEARRWRRDNQPVNQPNCGSVFANPPEMAAGRVVELLGMKGEAAGGARVSEVHANFIVAADGATAADVLTLIRRAMRRARDELGITLRTEVQLVGDFSATGAGGPGAAPAGHGEREAAGPATGEGER
jgi:UDP-N-acetylmuramate dehydrogenase